MEMAAFIHKGIPLSLIAPRFLHSNSTSHTWPFSAIAELIDNAYDPDVSAKQFWINKSNIKHQDCLTFTDNGKGMDYEKMHKMLSFGFSDKQTLRGHAPVGLYGNGFKSGSMRLGKDAIVFSKKDNTMCVGFLSQTYLENIKAQNVIVPIAMFTKTGQNVSAVAEHADSLNEILRHSMFNTEEELLSEFGIIASSGTRIIIWNLVKRSPKELEFDFIKDDIRIPIDMYKGSREEYRRQAWGDMPVPESEYSLREYCSILYLNPRMDIILQGLKVEIQAITETLSNIYQYTYKPACLKKEITVNIGINTKSKEHYGLMMYHNNRLIKAYERVPCQRKANCIGVRVIGVIECNYLTPIHNKQDFDSTEEYRNTLIGVGKKVEKYSHEFKYLIEQKTDCTKPFQDTDEQHLKLKQKNSQQTSTATHKRKKSLDLGNENLGKKKVRGKGSMVKKEESDISHFGCDDKKNYKIKYWQVLEAIGHLQDKLIKLRKELKKEGVDTMIDSLKYNGMLSDCYENMGKDLEEIKTKSENVELSVKDAAPLTEASKLGGNDSQFQIWRHETEDKSGLKVKELKERLAHLLVTFFPALDREQVTDEILTQVIDVISPTETKNKGKEFNQQEAHLPLGSEEDDKCSTSTQPTHTSHQVSAVTDVLLPESVKYSADSGAYSFLCSHAGRFYCKLTNLVFEMKGSGKVLYTFVSWDKSQLQGMGQFQPAGPLYNITCIEDSILYLHLPHCEIHTENNQIELAVAHITDDNVEILQPLKITNTHVILEVPGLSIFGLLRKWFFKEPINAQVLLFYKENIGTQRKRKLHIHLLPGNVSVKQVQQQHQGNTYIPCSSICQLIPGKKYKPLCKPYVSQPKVETFGCDFGPNYHPTFEVILNTEVEDLTLGLLDETDKEVWEPRHVILTADKREADASEFIEGAEFLDKHSDKLIQRASSVMEIADTLKTKEIISDEMYSEIGAENTNQHKMRKLYEFLHSAGKTAKAEFYAVLKEKQSCLVHDLENE
ncbi:uncharacterized protein LOC128524327 isoform X1 [Clarias gariepinus]|uniref:uncharacterized protein LOC128524327 isoform X1 n=1 Tax=Clarias gariepinus TaxID=13013 RepID=UPI00234CD9B1|nr:uncharacterized protein LOC128524327 isoform X1 [Clarias gariepinus]XP_053352827.1 uncharacterized protein LOC128524327 isoform X1 [Clarias gariepinus]